MHRAVQILIGVADVPQDAPIDPRVGRLGRDNGRFGGGARLEQSLGGADFGEAAPDEGAADNDEHVSGNQEAEQPNEESDDQADATCDLSKR